jgi:hypothetical protein
MQPTRKVFQGGSFAAPTRNLFVCEGTWVSIAQICYVLDGGLKPTISPPYPLPLTQHGLQRAPLGQEFKKHGLIAGFIIKKLF